MSKQISTEEFIKRAKEVHGDKYDYSNVEYTTMANKVNIMCHIHDVFSQSAGSHLCGRGCPKCARENSSITKPKNTEWFIQRATKIHDDKYDYSKVKYVNSITPVIIGCKVHTDFLQIPANHLRGADCPECNYDAMSKSRTSDLDSFIQRARTIHDNFYTYDKAVYTGNNKKLCITCPKHEDFYQTPNNHLNGHGCPHCNSSKGELAVQRWLIQNNIPYSRQKRFHDCKYKGLLSFDFAVYKDISHKQLLCLIEFDGGQHEKCVKRFGLESFTKTIIRDHIKNTYCENKGIQLIRIPASYIANVGEILEREIPK